MTGNESLALGALDAGVGFVTGYPGSPATETLEAFLHLGALGVRVEWATNEKSAFDAAFGASLGGARSLLCLKSVGLNVALDSLMVSNLAGGTGGFVVLTGDDPGGWGSQNEEDSRPLAVAAEVPLLEPTSAADARAVMRQAFALSERFEVPVVVRITRALAGDQAISTSASPARLPRRQDFSRHEPDRFNVLPVHVVDYHRHLQLTLERIRSEFECSSLNGEEGSGRNGIIAAGHAHQKLTQLLAHGDSPALRILRLVTLSPLPQQRIRDFLREVDQVLILEEVAPYVELQVQAIAQRAGLTLPVFGRSTLHLPGVGELFSQDIAQALACLAPDWLWKPLEPGGRVMPSRQPLCDDCPYRPAFRALLAVMAQRGGRDAYVVVGETGCMVRAQLPPWELLDVKYAMGSSIGLAAGLARTGIPQKVIALSGDSALLHSGLAELIDAVQAEVQLLVMVLANETTALSGGQPHPGTNHDAQGRTRRPVDLAALILATGADLVRTVDPEQDGEMRTAIQEGLAAAGVSVIIAHRACPRFEGKSTSAEN